MWHTLWWWAPPISKASDLPRKAVAHSWQVHEELRNDICRVSSRFPSLAAFQFLSPSPEVEDMFKSMGAVARRNGLHSLACLVLGYVTQNDVPMLPTPDSVMTLKLVPSIAKICSVDQELRWSTRLNSPKVPSSNKNQSKNCTMDKPWPTVTVKQAATRRDSALFIQHVCDKYANQIPLCN